MSKLRLSLRKKLVEELAASFDAVYERLVRRDATSIFDHETTQAQYPNVTFSSTAMHIGCGPVRLAVNRCDFVDEVVSTREYTDCYLAGTKEQFLPLPRCNRTWMLKSKPREGEPTCQLADGTDCRLCRVVEARHTAAMQRLQSEVGELGERRYVVMKLLIFVPGSDRRWDAFDRGELHVDFCKELPVRHAAALLFDRRKRVAWLCEAERLTRQVVAKVNELVADLGGGMEARVHRLCRQYQSTPEGQLRLKWCVMYSQAMALALTKVQDTTTEDDYLSLVFQIMHAYMRQFVS